MILFQACSNDKEAHAPFFFGLTVATNIPGLVIVCRDSHEENRGAKKIYIRNISGCKNSNNKETNKETNKEIDQKTHLTKHNRNNNVQITFL